MTELLYGVWRPGLGWLKRNSQEYIAFDHKEVAQQTADRIGGGAKVYFIDDSLADIEPYFLELESKPKRWWKGLLK